MTDDEASFVEAMGRFLGDVGMTPMAGRMWAWLLICEPPEQTAAEIATALQASRGAISGTARVLTSAGMVRRTTRRGDRREWFSAPPGTFDGLLHSAGTLYGRVRVIAGDGLETIRDRPASSRARLQEVHDAFAFFEREIPAIVSRFEAERSRDTRAGTHAGGKKGAA